VKAKKVVLATGPTRGMLPACRPDDTILTNYEILRLPEMRESLVVVGSGRGGRGVCVHLSRASARRYDPSKMLPRVVPVEDEEISRSCCGSSRSAAST